MKKTAIASAVALALGGASFGAQAGVSLAFDAGTDTDADGFVDSGSWFAMDTNGDLSWAPSERTGIADSGNHFQLGTFQTAANTKPHPEVIDNQWVFFFNTGVHNTVSGRGPAPDFAGADASGDLTINMDAWAVDWSTTYDIDMGGDAANFGTQDLDGDGDAAGGGDLNSGLAKIVCSSAACAAGDTFVLDYHAQVPQGDASGFGAVPYELHMTGTIVPVPAAVWLFGSGLIGLVGIARRKQRRS